MKRILSILMMVLLISACSTSTESTATETEAAATAPEVVEEAVPNMDPSSVVGSYDVSISGTPEGDLAATLDFMMDDNALTAAFSNEEGSAPIEDIEIVGNTIKGKFYNEEYGMWVDLELNPTPTDISGEVSASGFSFPLTGTKK